MALQEELERQGNWLFKRRGWLPVIILVAGLAVHACARPAGERPGWACLAISLSGLCLRAYTVGYSAPDTSGRNTWRGQVAGSLNTTGIYSVVRHPLYLGNFLAWLGVSLLTGHAWFVLLACCFFWIYHERVMFAEEQFLREKFGVIYTRWASRTPAFIPDFRLFVRPVTRFSWRKVARNEKNGVLALFLVFSAFDVAGRWVDGRVGYDRFYATATAVSLLAYLVSRYLKKHTRVLDERSRDKIIAGEL